MNEATPNTYDIAIIGGGGAGLTAAIYAARARRRTVVFERLITGGQIATTELVENYPGFPQGINGFDFAQNLVQQAERFGAEMRYEDVAQIERLANGTFRVETNKGAYRAHAVVATAGADYNKLGVAGEDQFVGRGVSYCATCDAAFFQDQDVIVVGGGDAAFDEALFTTRYASKVRLVHRRADFRASALLQERVFANAKIEIVRNTVVDRILGTEAVEGAELRNVETGATQTLATAAVFIFIGQTPNRPPAQGPHRAGRRRPRAGRPADAHDRARPLRRRRLADAGGPQLVSACGDGATAALAAEAYLAEAGIGEG